MSGITVNKKILEKRKQLKIAELKFAIERIELRKLEVLEELEKLEESLKKTKEELSKLGG